MYDCRCCSSPMGRVAVDRRRPDNCVWPHASIERRGSPRSVASRLATSAERGEPTPMNSQSQGSLNHTFSTRRPVIMQYCREGGRGRLRTYTNATNVITTGGI